VFPTCKIFEKNTTRSVAEVWRFFSKPEGLDLAGGNGTLITFAKNSIMFGRKLKD